MNCKNVQGLISPFIDNQLDEVEKKEFLAHVETCPACLAELEMMKSLIESTAQLNEELEVPDRFHNDLMDRLRSYEKFNIKNKRNYYYRTIASIAAIFMLVISIGAYKVILGNLSQHKSESLIQISSIEQARDQEVSDIVSESIESSEMNALLSEPDIVLFDENISNKAVQIDPIDKRDVDAKLSIEETQKEGFQYNATASEDILLDGARKIDSGKEISYPAFGIYVGIFVFTIILNISIFIYRRKKI